MKKNSIYFGILVAVMLGVTAFATYGMLNTGREGEEYQVSVIVSNSSSDRWIAFREGLKQGAADNHIQLNIVSTVEFTGLSEECQIIRREFENGAKGVIVEPCSSQDEEGLLSGEVSEGAVIFVGTDVMPEGLHTVVMPDHYEVGSAIAGELLKDYEGRTEGLTVGILCGNQEQLSMQKRLSGFLDALEGTGIEVVWTAAEEGDGVRELKSFQEEQPAEVLITLENDETELAVDYLLTEENSSCVLYGEGCSEKAVYYLDKGLIQGLIVPNEFHMGYLSMEEIAKQLLYGASPAQNREIEFLTINKENLYDVESQKILFPIVQ